MNKEVLYVVLPCYNEEKNIEGLIKEWISQQDKLNRKSYLLQIVIVDDGSSDKTLEICEAISKRDKNVTVIKHRVNQGLGEAINTGINYVLSRKNKGLVCIMDADLTHQPFYIYSMIDKLKGEKCDCVIASRYRKDSKVEGLSLFRKFLSYGARVVYMLTLRIPNVRDYTCGYRIYTTSLLETLYKKYNGKIVKEKGFACMMEILFKIKMENFRISEVPFVLKYQLKQGKSKMKVFKTTLRSLIMIYKFRIR